MKLQRLFALLVLTFFTFAFTASAQIPGTSPTDGVTPAPMVKGAHPLGSYGGSNFDKVNLFNGNLSLTFPLASLNGRGGLGASVVLSYNSKIWRIENIQPISPGDTLAYPLTDDWDSNLPNFTPGWTLHAGRLMVRQSGYDTHICAGGTNGIESTYWGHTLTNVTFTAPDGTEYEFKDVAHNYGEKYDFTDSQCPDSQDGGSRGTKFVTRDGTAATFISDTEVKDFIGPVGAPRQLKLSGWVFLRDGMRFRIVDGVVTKAEDRNGNIVRYEYILDSDNRNTAYLSKITDTLGRMITIEYPTSGQDLIIVHEPGVGGVDRVTSVKKTQLANALAPGQSIQNLSVLFPPVTPYNPDGPHNPYVIDQIVLPSGHTWHFRFNSYSEITEVTTPTGGKITYEMGGMNGPGLTELNVTGVQATFRRVTKRTVYPDQNGGMEGYTTYSDPSLKTPNVTTGAVNPVLEAQYDANNQMLAMTKHRFWGSPLDAFYPELNNNFAFTSRIFKPWKESKEKFSIAMTNGGSTELHRMDYNWEQAGGTWYNPDPTAYFQPDNNPRVRQQKNTWLDSNLVTTTDYTYDPYNNVLEEQVSGFGTGAPGAALRNVKREYVTDAAYLGENITTATVNQSAYLRSLVKKETISVNGALGVESVTDVTYDAYGGQMVNTGLVDDSRNPNRSSGWTIRGNVTSVTHRGLGTTDDSTLSMGYDETGNVRKVTHPPTMDGKQKVVTITYENTVQKPYRFAYPTGTSTPVGVITLTTSQTYDSATGLLTSSTGVNNETTTYQYNDPLDRLTFVQPPPGVGTTTLQYSPAGSATTSVTLISQLDSGRSLTSTTEYDGLLRVTKERRNDVGSNEVYTETLYDGMGRVRQVINPKRNTPQSGDSLMYGTTTSTYDMLSRVTSVSSTSQSAGAMGTVTTSYLGNTVTVTDQAGRQRASVTDALGRVTSVSEPTDNGVIAPNGTSGTPNVVTTYGYDVRGNLLSVTQGGQSRTYVYDALARLRQATTPESGTINYAYDQASNLINRQDARGASTNYSYDELYRPLTRTYTGTASDVTGSVTYTYDEATVSGAPGNYVRGASRGMLTSITTAAAGSQDATKIVYGYQTNGNGRLMQRGQVTGADAFLGQVITHNPAGMVTEEEYASGARMLYSFNDAGQLASVGRKRTATSAVTTLASGVQYAPMGGLASQQLGNGLQHNVSYNSRMQATTIQLTKPGTGDLLKLEYDYNGTNNNGNVGQIKITQNGAPTPQFTQTFGYDGLNRLKTAQENGGTNWTQTYSYDRFGNRTAVAGTNPQTLTISATNNQIQGPGYNYDAAGNLTATPDGRSYVYDAENRLVTVKVGATVVAAYHYDGEGKRVKKVVGTNAPLRMVYGVGGNLVDEYEGASATANAPTKEYVYGANRMLAEVEFPGCNRAAYKYVTADALGSPRILTNPAGAVISRHDYLPFGEEIAASIGNRSAILGYGQVDKVRKKFTGYERDDETGLDFAQARYFSSGMGRFISPDEFNDGPVELFTDGASVNPTFYADLADPQTLNKYQYCFNNPLLYVDPTGHQGKSLTQKLKEAAYNTWNGAASAWSENNGLGSISGPQNTPGRVIGHAVSIVQGAVELGLGFEATFGGGAEAILTSPAAGTGIGAAIPLAGAAVSATGVVVTAHGTGVLANTVGNVINGPNVMMSQNGSGSNGGGNDNSSKPRMTKSQRAAGITGEEKLADLERAQAHERKIGKQTGNRGRGDATIRDTSRSKGQMKQNWKQNASSSKVADQHYYPELDGEQ